VNQELNITIESAEQFVSLLKSTDENLYRRVANGSATEETWREVVANYPEMRVWVARNKTVPLNILATLAQDIDPSVRHAVAMKRKCGSEILQRLAKDADDSVRLRVALNPSTPKAVLEQLLADRWDRVVEEAQIRLKEDFGEF
jgi:hypothetical protein